MAKTAGRHPVQAPGRLKPLVLALLVLGGSHAAGAQELVQFEIVDFAIPLSLTGVPGDAERGSAIVQDASNATCLICHSLPMPWQPDHGNLGPDLRGVGNYYTAAEFRLRLVNPKVLNPDTIMPAYYRTRDLTRVQEQYLGRTIYSAQDIEDVVAYLLTLTGE